MLSHCEVALMYTTLCQHVLRLANKCKEDLMTFLGCRTQRLSDSSPFCFSGLLLWILFASPTSYSRMIWSQLDWLPFWCFFSMNFVLQCVPQRDPDDWGLPKGFTQLDPSSKTELQQRTLHVRLSADLQLRTFVDVCKQGHLDYLTI